jgi:hypothetical protein
MEGHQGFCSFFLVSIRYPRILAFIAFLYVLRVLLAPVLVVLDLLPWVSLDPGHCSF